jgi:hypothetical protein
MVYRASLSPANPSMTTSTGWSLAPPPIARSLRGHACLMSWKNTRPMSSMSSDAAVTGREMCVTHGVLSTQSQSSSVFFEKSGLNPSFTIAENRYRNDLMPSFAVGSESPIRFDSSAAMICACAPSPTAAFSAWRARSRRLFCSQAAAMLMRVTGVFAATKPRTIMGDETLATPR